MNTSKTRCLTGFSALGLLSITFALLKLFGVTTIATWSWWWVTAPLWGGYAVGLAILLAIFVYSVIVVILAD